MAFTTDRPLTYLITSGELTTDASDSLSFESLLTLVHAAVRAQISFIQLREKDLPARALYELAREAARITRGSLTRLLVNDRADIAHTSGADGVHLTTRSLSAAIVRRTFGNQEFLIGISAHSLDEAAQARNDGADFATFSPIFDTPSKRHYGLPPVGLDALRRAAHTLAPFPLIALGGITTENAALALQAGAHGIAGIRLFADADNLEIIVRTISNFDPEQR